MIRMLIWRWLGYTQLPLNAHDMQNYFGRYAQAHREEHQEMLGTTHEYIRRTLQECMPDVRSQIAAGLLGHLVERNADLDADLLAAEALRYADALLRLARPSSPS